MKIHLGPYINWIGPYQIADKLQKLGLSEDRCYAIGEWLADTWLTKACEWVHSKRKRKQKIRIDRYDTWNMDSTLALIVLPMLKQLKRDKHGAPLVEDRDVPEHLRSTATPSKENEYDLDDNHFKRWDWVLDEMIWAFEQMQPDCDWEAQFHSGVKDTVWVVETTPHPQTGEMRTTRRLEKGPNDTSHFDKEGYLAHSARIDNGLRLFGTYFRALWD